MHIVTDPARQVAQFKLAELLCWKLLQILELKLRTCARQLATLSNKSVRATR